MPTESATPLDTPLACVADAISANERSAHFELIRTLLALGSMRRRAMHDGYEFEFPADSFADLCRFVENERKCCPFLSFTLGLTPNGGPVTLQLSGPKGTREFLDAEFPR